MKLRIPIPSVRMPQAPSFFISSEAPPVKVPFLSLMYEPRSLSKWLLIWAFCLYLAFCFSLYVVFEAPRLANETTIRFGADSPTYWEAAAYREDHAYHSNLVSFTANYLGPVMIARLCGNGLGVIAFNLILFFISVEVACSIPGVNRYWLVFFLALSAETAPVLVTLNKEILVLVSALLVAKYVYSQRRSMVLLFLLIVASIFARWEQIAIIFLFLFLRRRGSYTDRNPRLAIAAVIAGLAIVYPLIIKLPGSHIGAFTQYTKGANTIVKLNNIQANFGFPIVVVPKIIMNVFGELLRPMTLMKEHSYIVLGDVHTSIIIPLFSMALVALLVLAYRRGRLNPSRPIAFLMIIYMIMTAVTPFIQPRYNYFVYILLCVELAKKEESDSGSPLPARPALPA